MKEINPTAEKESTHLSQLHNIRHSLAHLLAMEILKYDSQAKLGIGPVIENGFYYDIQFSEGKIPGEKDLKEFQKGMKKLASRGIDFVQNEISNDEALKVFADQPFKIELINELIEKGETLSVHTSGDFTDLCSGPHVKNSKEIPTDGFELDSIAAAYWRGSEKNPSLTRIYGIAFEGREELDAFKARREDARKRDHRVLGKELGLFVFSEIVGKGLPLWTTKGATMRREMERFIVDEEIKRGYSHVYTPDIANLALYEKSGHYPYYKDSMYAPIKIDEEEYMLRPMTCPHHFELYLSEQRSYRDLPMRIAELAKLYRYEQSGELNGLIRVRSFCLSDAHIICTDAKQAKEEVRSALELIDYIQKIFGLEEGTNYSYRLSLGNRADEAKYFKDDAAWDTAENALREVLVEKGAQFIEVEDEAAFYGPKIDVQMKNVNGKEDTAFTVQYDFVMPKRFKLEYTGQDGHRHEALVIHRSSVGAIERVMAFLIEHFAGNFPLWISPEQVAVIPIAETHNKKAQEVFELLKSTNIRTTIDTSKDGFGKKVRAAKKDRLPYFIIIGDKDIEADMVTLESRDSGNLGQMKIEDILVLLKTEIETKKLPEIK